MNRPFYIKIPASIAPCLLFFFQLFVIPVQSQTNYQTRSDEHIFWQPNLVIDTSDYKGTPHSGTGKVLSNVAIWTALDVPKIKEGKIKIYIAPVFICDFSSRTSGDSLEMAYQRAYFDICEIVSRNARKKINHLLKTTNNYDTISISFVSIIKEMNEDRLRRNRAYNRNVINNKKENKFSEWRTALDDELERSIQWSTSPEECFRFVKNSPLDITHAEDEKLNPKLNDGLYEKILDPDTWHADFYQVSRRRLKSK